MPDLPCGISIGYEYRKAPVVSSTSGRIFVSIFGCTGARVEAGSEVVVSSDSLGTSVSVLLSSTAVSSVSEGAESITRSCLAIGSFTSSCAKTGPTDGRSIEIIIKNVTEVRNLNDFCMIFRIT